jgi:hypothetical protein
MFLSWAFLPGTILPLYYSLLGALCLIPEEKLHDGPYLAITNQQTFEDAL